MPGEETDKSDSENSISSLVTSNSDRSHTAGERADFRKKKAFLKVNQIIRGWGSYKAHILF